MKQLLTLVLVLIASCSFAMFDDSAEYFRAGKKVLIATSTDAGDYKLQVNGNAYVNGNVSCATPTTAVQAANKGYVDNIASGIVYDTWHNASGSFNGGWVDYHADTYGVQYKKDSSGFVCMRGRMEDGSFSSYVLTLPVGYRPRNRYVIIPIVAANGANNGDGLFAYCFIQDDGKMYIFGNQVNSWVSLDGIRFEAEQ